MEIIQGKFTKIIYSSPESNFFVVDFKIEKNQDDVKAKLNIKESSNSVVVILHDQDFELKILYEIQVEKQISKKYGFSYIVLNKIIVWSNDQESAINFLSSKLFKGIRTVTATKIVQNIGLKLFDNPQKYKIELDKLIGIKKSEIVINGLVDQSIFNQIYKKFLDKRLSINILNVISKIFSKNELNNFLENSVFDLIELIESVDFFELNKIAKEFYRNYNEEIVLQYLTLWSIYEFEKRGSTIINILDIYNKVKQYHIIDKAIFTSILKQLVVNNKIIIHDDKKNLSSMLIFNKEKYIANKLKKLNNKKTNYQLNKLISENLDKVQKEALNNSLENSFSIISGSPGTGKTLLIKLIMENLNKINKKNIELLAPTGKAATQISKKTLQNAKTIHSFLKYNKINFDINEKNPSNVEIIIIDEFSMININLFYSVLKATPKLKHLILIGDHNQLPSIGAGYILNDLINSNYFKVNKLEKIYRQSEGSNIINNALLINKSQMPIFNKNETPLFECINDVQVIEFIKHYVKEYLNKNDNLFNQQILIPMYSGVCGIDNVNIVVQKIVNQNKDMLFKTTINSFYKGDKVIQLENDIDKNIFNGEIGYINDVVFKNNQQVEKVIIKFDERKIEYTLSQFNENIKLAYAISIHKFQGSECNDILILLLNNHLNMLSKKLFYTAYTRAMKSVSIISSLNIIKRTINNDIDSQRKCNLPILINKN